MTNERHGAGLLDTCVLIDLDKLTADQLPTLPKVSTVTLAELGLGVTAASNPSERLLRTERLQVVENSFEVLPFTPEAARRFTHMAGLIVASGRSPKPRRLDVMIGAVASVNNPPLYPRNAKDFEGLDSALSVIAI
jgi:predicted nucleic acid-binding protein